jgi:O-antigen/teichoic acid export membrane protein
MSMTLAMTVWLQLLGLVSGAVVARLLGVEGRGLLAAIVLWPSVIAYVGDLGGPLAYVYLAASDRANVRRLLGNALLVAVCQAVVLTGIGIPLVMSVLRPYPTIVGLALAFLVLYLPLNLTTRYLNAINQGLGRFDLFNGVRLAIQGSYVLGVATLFVLSIRQLEAVIFVVVASNVVALLVALRAYGLAPRGAISLKLIPDVFGYGIRGHIGNLTPVDSMQLDLIAVVAFLGPYAAGLYAIASAAAMVVRAQGTAFGLVALPGVAASSSPEAKIQMSGEIFRAAFVLFACTAAIVVTLAGLLVPVIYGSAFGGAVPLVRILVLGMVAASLRQVLADCLRGAGRPLAGTVAEIASWAAALAGLLLLLPRFGALGAALAVSLSYLAALLVSVALSRSMGLTVRDLFLIRPQDLTRAWAVVVGSFGLMKRPRLKPALDV